MGELTALFAGFAAGVLTPLLVEYLHRYLFDRSKLKISAVLVDGDPDDLTVPPFLHVNAVNTADVPVILTAVFFTVWHGKQAVGMSEPDLDGLTQEHEFPLKLQRHEAYEQSVEIVSWVRDFLVSRATIYDDESSLDYSKLEFDVSFLDTTERDWQGKRVKLYAHQAEALATADSVETPVEPPD